MSAIGKYFFQVYGRLSIPYSNLVANGVTSCQNEPHSPPPSTERQDPASSWHSAWTKSGILAVWKATQSDVHLRKKKMIKAFSDGKFIFSYGKVRF